MELTVESIEGTSYQNFLDYIRSEKTLKNYLLYLNQFLSVIPNDLFVKNIGKKPSTVSDEKINQFVLLARSNTDLTKQIIKAYVRELKTKVDKKEVSASNIKNRLKPIKALFAANEIDFSWKLINKSLPKTGKAPDRAYTREEIKLMLDNSRDIVDRIIILLFSSAGFRVESWDYFTWNDVKFFYTDDKEPKGLAIRVYAGDAEEYWTHGTPEAQKALLLYRENWNSRFGRYPELTDPLIVATKVLYPKRLRMGGVRSRVVKLLKSVGIRLPLEDGKIRHDVPADHGFRKYFNTMMRRAKVNYLDKEDMMGHDNGLESSYERYTEEDFERFPEYQKAIPFLTIDDSERHNLEVTNLQNEKDILKLKVNENKELEIQLREERHARLKFEKEMKQAFAQLRDEKLTNYKK